MGDLSQLGPPAMARNASSSIKPSVLIFSLLVESGAVLTLGVLAKGGKSSSRPSSLGTIKVMEMAKKVAWTGCRVVQQSMQRKRGN